MNSGRGEGAQGVKDDDAARTEGIGNAKLMGKAGREEEQQPKDNGLDGKSHG